MMLKFLLRRMANYLVLVALATTAGYFLASAAFNPRSFYEGRNPKPSEASINHKLDELGVNDHTPVMTRYVHWMKGVLHGDFGKTFEETSVWAEMKRRMGVSLRLLLIGSILGALFGVGLGVLGAVKQYSFLDYGSTALSFLVLSTPVFLLIVLLKVGGHSFNVHTGTSYLHYVGEKAPGLTGSVWTHLNDRIGHLILPTIAITLPGVAFYSRYQRNTFLDVMGSDFLRTAQAKGLRRGKALVKHGLRTALIPLVTFFAYGFGTLIIGAVFTETLFGWHGMGEWFIQSVQTNDVNIVAAITLFSSVLVLLAGLLSDVAYAALDPRVRIR